MATITNSIHVNRNTSHRMPKDFLVNESMCLRGCFEVTKLHNGVAEAHSGARETYSGATEDPLWL